MKVKNSHHPPPQFFFFFSPDYWYSSPALPIATRTSLPTHAPQRIFFFSRLQIISYTSITNEQWVWQAKTHSSKFYANLQFQIYVNTRIIANAEGWLWSELWQYVYILITIIPRLLHGLKKREQLSFFLVLTTGMSIPIHTGGRGRSHLPAITCSVVVHEHCVTETEQTKNTKHLKHHKGGCPLIYFF